MQSESSQFPPRHSFGRSKRLAHARQYQAVYAARTKKILGPLAASGAPNSLPHYRLGLSVGRAVGGAVERNRIKRLIREAFRLEQFSLPVRADGFAYDLVIHARAHRPRELADYRADLRALAEAIHRATLRRESAS